MICEDESEREFLIALIQPLLKGNTLSEIDLALGYACRTVARSDNNLNLIVECVKQNVGKI
jgi:hypothetical protein